MFDAILRAIGRGLVAVATGLWNALIMPALRAIGASFGRMIERVLPWVIGLGGLWFLIVFKPAVADAILQLAIIAGIVWAGFKFLTRKPPPVKK